MVFVDVETTGLPLDWRLPYTRTSNWPRVVQLAYVICDGTGQELEARNEIIRPDGWTIPPDAARIHGITQERALAVGRPASDVLGTFALVLADSPLLVAHNVDFDWNVLRSEFHRHTLPIPELPTFCTMKGTTELMGRLTGSSKWPRLEQLVKAVLGETLVGAHDALVDARAAQKVFLHLYRQYHRSAGVPPV